MAEAGLSECVAIRLSAAFALVALVVVFIASVRQPNLLGLLINTRIVWPLIGTAILCRFVLAIVAFVNSARPSATRSLSALFWRDAWLRDSIKMSQPRTATAVGVCVACLKLGTVVLIASCALGGVFGLITAIQGVSAFVVASILGIVVQAIGGSVLLARQIDCWRTSRLSVR